MSWLYSRALAAAYLPQNYSDGAPSARSNVTTTPEMFLSQGKTTELLKLSRFGMKCKPLTDLHGADVLTLFLEAFPAKTSAAQEREQELTEKDQECGNTLLASLARYDRVTFSWKTPQCSLLGDSEEFSEIWPRWGSMRNGVSYQRGMLERAINETGYGSLPTPQAMDAHAGGMLGRGHLSNLRDWLREEGLARMPRDRNARFWEYLMMWPDDSTALKPLETVKYQQWLQQHSEFLASA